VAAPDAVPSVTGERQGCKTGEGRRKCRRRRAAAPAAAVAARIGGERQQRLAGCCCSCNCKGQRQAASMRECKQQRLLLVSFLDCLLLLL